MNEEIEKLVTAFQVVRRPEPWSADIKASDDFLDPLFKNYFARLGLRMEFPKRDYCQLVDLLDPADIDKEVREKLDVIVEVSQRARSVPLL